jgi:hypothetical protein
MQGRRDRVTRGTEGERMPSDDARGRAGAVMEGAAADSTGHRPRGAFRRRLPFGRAAVLVVGERAHIVGIADVSVSGAYLTTRAPVSAGETHVLKVLLLPARVEIMLRAEIVRVSLADHESLDHPRGVAVRFVDLDETADALLRAFVAREPPRRRG